MAKKSAAAQMTRGERAAGTVFFVIYLLVMPLLGDRLFDLAERLLAVEIAPQLRSVLFYYLLFAVTLLVFHGFLARTSGAFLDNLNRALGTLCVGLVAFYGLNELVYRLCSALWDSRVNLNDTAIAAQASAAPRLTVLIAVALAPFVEETLFRGLVFGCIRERSRVVAYLVSSVLFALLHVWTFALSAWDLRYFALMVQYLAPGLVFAWVYDRSDTLWTSFLLHALVNALALWLIFP